MFGIQAAPVGEYGMLSGAFRVEHVDQGEGEEQPSAPREVHLIVTDVFVSPQGAATVERLLHEVKAFLYQSPVLARVSIIANKSLVSTDAFGTYSFTRFQHTALCHGYLPISLPAHRNAAACASLTNAVFKRALTAAAVMRRVGVPGDVQSIIFSYLPCASFMRAVSVRRGVKRRITVA